jgi:hypothetical protein
MKILAPDAVASPWASTLSCTALKADDVLVLRVAHGRRDIEALFGRLLRVFHKVHRYCLKNSPRCALGTILRKCDAIRRAISDCWGRVDMF